MLEKIVTLAIVQKGFWIGLGVAIMQVMNAIRKGEFKWSLAITTVIGGTLMGTVAYHVGESAGVTPWLNAMWTIFLSANAFLVIGVVSDKDFATNIIKTFIKNKVQ